MPREYTPQTPHFNKTRLQKAIKELLAEAKVDRELAIEGYTYFKGMLEDDEGNQDNDARARMVDCLKVAQSARNNSVKLIALVQRSVEAPPAIKGKGVKSDVNPLFNS